MLSPSHPQSVRVPCRIPSSVCDVYLVSLDRRVSGTSSIPTATLLEHALLAQGFLGVSKVAFPRRLQLQNRDSTGANLSNAIKCRCRGKRSHSRGSPLIKLDCSSPNAASSRFATLSVS